MSTLTDVELEQITKRYGSLVQCRTALEIRNVIAATGLKAERGNAFACALAEYMKLDCELDQYDNSVAVSTGGTSINSFVRPNTDAMADFVRNFDDGHYPELMIR